MNKQTQRDGTAFARAARGDKLREEGYDVDSLAIVESMDPQTGDIEFR